MQFTRKQAFIFLGAAYLIFTTAIAIYTAVRASYLSLPIYPLSIVTAILPSISVILNTAARQIPKRQLHQIANVIIIISSSVFMTLLAGNANPAECLLRNRWQSLFHNKSLMIRTIQDTLTCCGFKNSRDMVWPFPDKSHGPNACEIAFGRTNSCLDGWRSEEQRLSGLLFIVVGAIVVFQLAVNTYPADQRWQVIQRREEPRRVIQYDEPGRYTDEESQPLAEDRDRVEA